MAQSVGLPRPKELRSDVIAALGELTNYTAGVSVHHHLVRARVLERRDLDPNNLPHGWVLRGYGGILRKIDYAFRNSRAEFVSRPLTKQGSQKGEWELTELGVALAKQINGLVEEEADPSPHLPPPSAFFDDVVKALGELTDFRRHNTVPCEDVVRLTLEKAGYDPDNLPDDWTLPLIRRKIHQAFRQQTNRGRRSMKSRHLVFTEYGKRGFWKLTRRGVDHSKDLQGLSGKNETAIWLQQQGAGIIEKMRSTLRRKLPVSATMELIDDHVNNFIVRLIRRDSIRKLRDKGKRVVPSKIVSYCVRSAYTDIRSWGVDAHCRTMMGARTEQNRKNGDDTRDRAPLGEDVIIVRDSKGHATFDYVDHDGGFMGAHIAAGIDELRGRVVDDFMGSHPEDWQDYAEVMDMMTDGLEVAQIAEFKGVPYRTASRMVRACQEVARGHRDEVFAF